MAELIEANGFRLYLLALGVGMGMIVLLLVVMVVSSPLYARRIQQQLEQCTAAKVLHSSGEGEDTKALCPFLHRWCIALKSQCVMQRKRRMHQNLKHCLINGAKLLTLKLRPPRDLHSLCILSSTSEQYFATDVQDAADVTHPLVHDTCSASL